MNHGYMIGINMKQSPSSSSHLSIREIILKLMNKFNLFKIQFDKPWK